MAVGKHQCLSEDFTRDLVFSIRFLHPGKEVGIGASGQGTSTQVSVLLVCIASVWFEKHYASVLVADLVVALGRDHGGRGSGIEARTQ